MLKQLQLVCTFILCCLGLSTAWANNTLPIIVVGAGAAGLSTAQKLQQAGQKVLVLESRSRIGGRVNSQAFDGVTLDLGASWIHGIEGNPIWPIAQKNKIQTIVFNEDEEAFSFYHKNGTPFSKEQNAVFTDFIAKIEDQLVKTNNQIPADQAIKKIMSNMDFKNPVLPIDELKSEIFEFFEYLAKDPYATSLNQLTSHYPKYEGYFPGNEMIFPQGYSQIIHALAQGLTIQKNTTIESIVLKKDHVELYDQNHKQYLASKVVVTVPLGVLKKNKIQFKPALPKPYQQAIQNIGFGSFNKVFLEFDQPLDLVRLRDNPTIGSYIQYKGEWFSVIDLTEVYHKPIYLMFFGGPRGEWINHNNDQEIWNYLHGALAQTLPKTPAQPKAMVVTRWGNDPQAYGSFSFPPPKYQEKSVDTLNTSIRHQLYFAGEHCTVEHAGTVHGAYISGQETANRILNQQ